MAPTYRFNGMTDMEALVAFCGFSPDRPVFTLYEGVTPPTEMLEIALEGLQGKPSRVIELDVVERLTRKHLTDPVWYFSLVPDGVRALGGSMASALSGGPLHLLEPDLLFTGWGCLYNLNTGERLAGECTVVSDEFRPDLKDDPQREESMFKCQFRFDIVDPESPAGQFLSTLERELR